MKLRFSRRENAPEKMLAEVAIEFDADTPLSGTKLVGFGVWQGDRLPYVTLPARAFGSGKERGYFDFLRPRQASSAECVESVERIKQWILDAYTKWDDTRGNAA